MVKDTLRSVLPLYSFLGILSIRNGKNGFQTSSFHAIFNVLKMPLVLAFQLFLVKNPQVLSEILRFDIFQSNVYSSFLRFTILIITQIDLANALLICFAQFLKRKKITEYMKRVSNMKIDAAFTKKLRKLWRKQFFIISLLFVITSTIQVLVSSSFTVLSLVVHLFLFLPYLFIASFQSFMKSFEIFFQVFMKDFKYRLSESMLTDEKVQKLIKRYQEICALNQDFNKIFGAQITSMTCCFALKLSSQVDPFNLSRSMK